MSQSKHTQESWRVHGSLKSGGVDIRPCEGLKNDDIAHVFGCGASSMANAYRIVDCVNACAGIQDPSKTIQQLLETCKQSANTIHEYLEGVWDGNSEGWQAVEDRLFAAITEVNACP